MATPQPSPSLPRPPSVPAAELVALLADADCAFSEVAQRCDMTVEELALYLTTDEGRERVMAAQTAAMMRVRLAATAHLNHAVSALSLMLMAYQNESETLFRDSPPTRKFRELQRVNARRAASLLTRLANLQYRPLIASPSPIPREGSAPEAASVAAPSGPNPSASRSPAPVAERDLVAQAGSSPHPSPTPAAPHAGTHPLPSIPRQALVLAGELHPSAAPALLTSDPPARRAAQACRSP